MPDEAEFHELTYYTLAHGGAEFVHQLAVDAWTAQRATEETTTMALFYALMGLYLVVEKGWTGRQVQLAHMRLTPAKARLPRPALPEGRGALTVSEVLKAEPGEARDAALHAWCESVWQAFDGNRAMVAETLRRELGVE